MTLGVLTVIVNACACWHGKKLCDENVFVSHGHPARPVQMSSVITVQPPQAVAGACAKNHSLTGPALLTNTAFARQLRCPSASETDRPLGLLRRRCHCLWAGRE